MPHDYKTLFYIIGCIMRCISSALADIGLEELNFEPMVSQDTHIERVLIKRLEGRPVGVATLGAAGAS
jgi:hypothetical protein